MVYQIVILENHRLKSVVQALRNLHYFNQNKTIKKNANSLF